MTLQTATAAKTASDSAAIKTKSVIDSLVMTSIDAIITASSTSTALDHRTYIAYVPLSADLSNLGDIRIVQSDRTTVALSDILEALTAAGYRTSCTEQVTREGMDDKVKLSIAWD